MFYLSIFCFLCLLALGAWVNVMVQKEMKKNLAQQLHSTLNTNVRVLIRWAEERKSDIKTWAVEPRIRKNILSLVRKTRPQQIVSVDTLKSIPGFARLRNAVSPLIKMHAFTGFVVFDRTGLRIASDRDEYIGKRRLIRPGDFLERSLKGETVFSVPFISDVPLYGPAEMPRENQPTQFVSTPVRNEAGEVEAVLAFRLDPIEDFSALMKYSQTGETGETYAFNRAGLMVSDSRFNDQLKALKLLPNQKDTRAMLHLQIREPVARTEPLNRGGFMPGGEWPLTRMAASAVKGESGIDVEGYRDYRGVRVVGAWTWLKQYGFGVATEMDVTEAYAPLITLLKNYLLVFCFLVLATLFSLVLRSRQIRSERMRCETLKALVKTRDSLETQVKERTIYLAQANEKLHHQIINHRAAVLAQRESELRYRTVLENAVDPIVMIDEWGRIENFNPAAEKVFGYRAREVIGKNVNLLMPEPYRSEHDEYLRNYLRTGKANIIGIGREVVGLRRDGTTFPMDLAVSEMFLGKKRKFVGILRDITERHQTRMRLQNYTDDLEQMVERRTQDLHQALNEAEKARDWIDRIVMSISDGLIVTDGDNRVVLMNRAAEKMLGVPMNQSLGRPLDSIGQDPTLREPLKSLLFCEDRTHPVEIELPGGNSPPQKIIWARTSILESKSATLGERIITLNDVTEERKLDRMKDEFVSTAAHELKTPMTSIRGYSELLIKRDYADSKKMVRFATLINREAENLTHIIDDLLDISQLESAMGSTLTLLFADVRKTLESEIDFFREVYSTHRFELEVPETLPKWRVDSGKIGQILKNLLSNAVKYSPGGGTIRVEAEIKGEMDFLVSIMDEGIGMTQDQVARVFDKFYRADASNTAIGGTGLGMTIVQKLVHAHGGKVWLESQKGKGTTIRFTIPRTRESQPAVKKDEDASYGL